MPSAIAVGLSTTPFTGSPRMPWYCLTAASVPGPKIPSAPPRTVMPAAMSSCCNCATCSDLSPRLATTSDGAACRGAARVNETPMGANAIASEAPRVMTMRRRCRLLKSMMLPSLGPLRTA